MRLIIAVILITFPSICYAEDKIDAQGVLAVAKLAGACGIMNEMTAFQQKTKMTGADDFVVRFWKTESARQGKTVEQMYDDCNKAIATYDNLWKSMGLQEK